MTDFHFESKKSLQEQKGIGPMACAALSGDAQLLVQLLEQKAILETSSLLISEIDMWPGQTPCTLPPLPMRRREAVLAELLRLRADANGTRFGARSCLGLCRSPLAVELLVQYRGDVNRTSALVGAAPLCELVFRAASVATVAKLIEQSWCEPVGIWSWDATFELAGCEFEQSLLYLCSNKNTHISYTHGLYMRICHGCFKIILPFPEITKVFLRSQSMPDLLGSSWYDMQFFSVVGSSGMETGRNSCLWRTWLLQLSGFRVGAVFNDFESHAKMLLKFHKSSRESSGVSGTHTEQGKTSLNLSACLFGVDDAHWFCVQIEYFPVAS